MKVVMLMLTEDRRLTREVPMIDIPAIKAKAEDVLKKDRIIAPIVNVFDIAASEGLAVKYRNFPPEYGDVSGFYFQKDKAIYLNVNDSRERQLFTVAHELGHYFLDHKPNEYGMNARKSAYTGIKHINEKEADCFAANLLMPEAMIKEELNKYPFLKGRNAPLLSLRFGVSSSAMTYRLRNLGLI